MLSFLPPRSISPSISTMSSYSSTTVESASSSTTTASRKRSSSSSSRTAFRKPPTSHKGVIKNTYQKTSSSSPTPGTTIAFSKDDKQSARRKGDENLMTHERYSYAIDNIVARLMDDKEQEEDGRGGRVGRRRLWEHRDNRSVPLMGFWRGFPLGSELQESSPHSRQKWDQLEAGRQHCD